MRVLTLLALFGLVGCLDADFNDGYVTAENDPTRLEGFDEVEAAPVPAQPTIIIVNNGEITPRSDFWPNGPDGPFETFFKSDSMNNVLPVRCLLISPADPDRYVFGESCLKKAGKNPFFMPDSCRAVSPVQTGELVKSYRARCLIDAGYKLAA